MVASVNPQAGHEEDLVAQYRDVRALSEMYCSPLCNEDYGLQAIPETSPAKWHLAHTSWFFETFVLKPFVERYREFHPQFNVLFNSYYNGIGEQHPRAQRGLLSRPTVAEVYAYRRHVDTAVLALLRKPATNEITSRILLGLHHEHQHQELFFTDLKYNLSCNPLAPAYLPWADGAWLQDESLAPLTWERYDGGIMRLGADTADHAFVFDNETPAHRTLIEPFLFASRPVSNGEFLQFVEAGGYTDPQWWLADGWQQVRQQQWQHPLYWQTGKHGWREFTLHGLLPLDPSRPVCHVSAYEADAYARWAGARLPTEQEWEFVARQRRLTGQFVDRRRYHPDPGTQADDDQLFGAVWQWTSSAYTPYPRYRPAAGALGEYNGKFMCNQLVLRGGACVSDRRHIRATYRNFFYPGDRWQFSGIRLARDPGEV